MSTISVGETVEIVALHAAAYAAARAPDLDDRVEALANDLLPKIIRPTVNIPRFFEALLDRLDAATIDLSAVSPGKRDQPSPDELQCQRIFFAALADNLRKRLEHAA